MQKVYPKSEIRKEVIGEIIGFDREKNSEACELVSSITGDNYVKLFHLVQRQAFFKKLALAQLFVDLDRLNKHTKLMNLSN